MRRDLSSILDDRKEREADIIWMAYEAPEGDSGLHTVTTLSTKERVIVGSAQGNQTWAPGSIVPVGRPGGAQSKMFILGVPPPGAAGGGVFPARAYPALPAPTPTCPVSNQLGRNYLGIDASDPGSTGHLTQVTAYAYADGHLGSAIGTAAVTGSDGGPGPPRQGAQRIHTHADTVIWRGVGRVGLNFVDQVVTWNPAGALSVLNTTHVSGTGEEVANEIAGPVWHYGTEDIYFAIVTDTTIQVYKVAVGASGTLVLADAAFGPPLAVASGAPPHTMLCCRDAIFVDQQRLALGSLTWTTAAVGGGDGTPVLLGGSTAGGITAANVFPEDGLGPEYTVAPNAGDWATDGTLGGSSPDQLSAVIFPIQRVSDPGPVYFFRTRIPASPGYGGSSCPFVATVVDLPPSGNPLRAFLCRGN